jgi:hypothetical protein
MVAAPSILDTPPSALSLARGSDSATWLELWSQHGWLCLRLSAEPTTALSDWLAGSIETELTRLGAVPRPDYVSSAFRAVLEDQIYRARILGFEGLAIQLPSLERWAKDEVLSAEDSAALLAWCEAARGLGVPTRLSTRDQSLRVYAAPVALSSVQGLSYPLVSDPPPPARPSGVRDVMESVTECFEPRRLPRPRFRSRAISRPERGTRGVGR